MSSWEFAPGWTNPKMTKAQVRKYIADMKEMQEKAKRKLKEAELNTDGEKEEAELAELEEKIKEIL